MTVTSKTERRRRLGPILYGRAKKHISAGAQVPSEHLGLWPSSFARARGVRVWDLQGRVYVDMSYGGLGSCVLGYADSDVDHAVHEAVWRGAMTTLNSPEVVELAELLLELHPWAEMVHYARTGGEAMTIAVRLAQSATGRPQVAFCGYHSQHHWYPSADVTQPDSLDRHLLTSLEPLGAPRSAAGAALRFEFNRIEQLEAIIEEHGHDLAAIVVEPVQAGPPEPGFLQSVRDLATRAGAALIFDEITTGWRLTTGGAHLVYGVKPDLSVFAKGMSNGYPMSAVLGVRSVMEATRRTFISGTFWTERIGPAAALATVRKHQKRQAARHLQNIGARVQAGWLAAAARSGLEVEVLGPPSLARFMVKGPQAAEIHTLFARLMLARGYLATGSFYPMLRHQLAHVLGYLKQVNAVFDLLVGARKSGRLEQMIGADEPGAEGLSGSHR